VHGGKFAHAGRKPRASGGMTANDYMNRNMKSANDEREGPKHLGGMHKGGRAHKMMGGPMIGGPGMPPPRLGPAASASPGGVPMDHPMHRRPEMGGRDMMRKDGGKAEHGESCSCSKCGGGRVGKAKGGPVSYGGSRPVGGRIARAGGGRTKKGTTVNIIIAPGGGGAPKPPMPMPPPGAAPPPGGPPGMHQGLPPPSMPPGGAPPPMGPPQMRARGGRAYPLVEGGAGGGLARLEKKKAYGGPPIHGAAAKPPMSQAAKPRKAGGRAYETGGAVSVPPVTPAPEPKATQQEMKDYFVHGKPPSRASGGRTTYPIKTGAGGGEARLAKIRAYGP